jgi:hypothetical protein
LEIRKRELRVLVEASEELNCNNLTIISWEEERQELLKGKK